ncbi:hypothetical protein O181_093669 [Austropuccinia psidii MF-1]|uniref:Reverse transcriptase domain-containing protein n=1 Tax=Austropuccinia psidii MF-1 TaxID=1389203 RepID=A0A9Q3PA19_9BASI|nr:hypothetical protein [Austropuccinia psidii MF-1]
MEFMKTIDMLKEDFSIPDEYISARLHSLFTKSAKKWYYKRRQDHGKHSWPWWKEQIISKWENYSWRFKMENSFEEAIFNIERDRPMSWFLMQKERLNSLHSDMSGTMVHKMILRKCGGDLEHTIRSRCIEPCSTEVYTNAMEDITTRTKIGRNWYKPPMDNKTSGKAIPNPINHMTKILLNVIKIEKDETKETKDVSIHESDSEPSKEEELPDELNIENINVSFEVTEVHTHLPQYSDDCMDLINVQDAKMQKTKPARGKCYTAASSCITNIVINNREAKIHLDSGAFCTCVGKDYLDKIYTNWQDKLMPIEGIRLSSASQNMHPLGIFEAEMIFPHPTGSIRLKVEFVVMNNCTSQHFILGNDYLNIYGIDINNHKDRYFTRGENKRQKFAFPPEKREITVIITWHNDKSRMVCDFRELNTYTILDRYQIPRIHATLTQLSKARFITSMDALKGFHQNVLTPHSRKLLSIISHCGIYEYLRMPFGIKNAPSHYQRMMNTIFPHELSEGWLIIYIYDMIICSETWKFH